MMENGGNDGATSETPATEAQKIALAHELALKFEALPPEGGIRPELMEYVSLYEHLYEDFSIEVGKSTSRKEREDNGYESSTLVYGEITFVPFAQQFDKIRTLYGGLQEPGGMYVDIGCGTGKPVFAAALLHDFDVCLGIEILEGLHGICTKVLRKWNEVGDLLPAHKMSTDVRFVHGDATVLDWSAADVVFANSTCFDDQLMKSLALKSEDLRTGAFVITTTRSLPSTKFEVLEQSKMSETWGQATVFIQRRL